MITNIAAHCKRLAKTLDVVIRHPVAFRHFIKALGYSGASWKKLVNYDARGSVNTHKRINKELTAANEGFHLVWKKERICE